MCRLSGVMIHVKHSVTHLVHAAGVLEENEAEASGSASVGVHLDGAVRHLSKLTEVILQVLFTRVPAEAAHEHFTGETVRHLTVNVLLFQIRYAARISHADLCLLSLSLNERKRKAA